MRRHNTPMYPRFRILVLGVLFLAGRAACAASVFLIGNSLTWDTVPSKLEGDVQWHVDCGKSLPYIHARPEKPCVKTSTLWPKALKEKQYDIVSMQSHYGATLEEDVATISKWVEMQKRAVFVIHTGWSRHATRADEWAATDSGGKMVHSRAHLEALLKKLQAAHPGREFRRTRCMDLLARVADDVAAGTAPFAKVEDVYRDAIHMNVVTGRYLMHNAMRHVLGQSRSTAGFEKLDPKVKSYLDGLLDTL
jgi:hypothetical protein